MHKLGIKMRKRIPVVVRIPIAIQHCFYDTGFMSPFFCVKNMQITMFQMRSEALAVHKLFSC